MKVPPAGISAEAWQEAVRAGFHATPEATRREIEEILAAAVPALGLVPLQGGPPDQNASTQNAATRNASTQNASTASSASR